MQIEISYAELLWLLQHKSGVNTDAIDVCGVESNTLHVNYKISSLIPTTIAIKIQLCSIENNNLHFFYNCSMATSLVIKGLITSLQNKIPQGISVDTTNHRIIVDLLALDVSKGVFQNLHLCNLTFQSNSLQLELKFV